MTDRERDEEYVKRRWAAIDKANRARQLAWRELDDQARKVGLEVAAMLGLTKITERVRNDSRYYNRIQVLKKDRRQKEAAINAEEKATCKKLRMQRREVQDE